MGKTAYEEVQDKVKSFVGHYGHRPAIFPIKQCEGKTKDPFDPLRVVPAIVECGKDWVTLLTSSGVPTSKYYLEQLKEDHLEQKADLAKEAGKESTTVPAGKEPGLFQPSSEGPK